MAQERTTSEERTTANLTTAAARFLVKEAAQMIREALAEREQATAENIRLAENIRPLVCGRRIGSTPLLGSAPATRVWARSSGDPFRPTAMRSCGLPSLGSSAVGRASRN